MQISFQVFTDSRQCSMQQQVPTPKQGSSSTGSRTSAAWLPMECSCPVSQCLSPGTPRYPQLLQGALSSPPPALSLPGQHCQLHAPGLAFSEVHARLLAQPWRLVPQLASQAAAPGQANSYRLTSPLLSPLTPIHFLHCPSANFHMNCRNLTSRLPPKWVRIC